MSEDRTDETKALVKREMIFAWVKRVIFLGWSMTVLAVFFDRFILFKFHQFLSWIK